MPISQYNAQSEHCFLEEVSQSSEILVLFISAINFCDFSLKSLIYSIIFMSCKKDSLFGWLSNC